MNHGREKRPSVKTKKKSLSDLKEREDKEILKEHKHHTFNQEKVSREISVIHPIEQQSKLK